MDHFDGLTPAEAERLAMLAKECTKVIQITGKILRHGYGSTHPDRPDTTNRALLGQEVTDLLAVLSLMEGDFDPLPFMNDAEVDQAVLRKLRYAHHQSEHDLRIAEALAGVQSAEDVS